MSHDQTLIWAKSVCNTGHQRKKLDERAEDKVVFNLFLPFMIHNRFCLFSHLYLRNKETQQTLQVTVSIQSDANF